VFLELPVVILFALYPRPRLAVPDRPLTEGSSAMPWPHWPILRRLARLEGERGDVPGWA
jgi:hypothetical protein